MKTKEEVLEALKKDAVLVADENKLIAYIHENGQLKQKIKYSHYLDINNMDILRLVSVSSDTHIFKYRLI